MARSTRLALPLLAALLAAAPVRAERPVLTWRDLVEIRQVESARISDDGSWVAAEARPDRGDGEAVFRAVESGRRWSIPRGTDVQLSPDGRWGAAVEQAPFAEREAAEDPDELASSAVLLDLRTGESTSFADPASQAFSADGRWYAVRSKAEKPEEDDEPDSEPDGSDAVDEEDDAEAREAGGPLTLVRLEDGARFDYADVARLSWSRTGAWLALVQETASGLGNRFAVLDCTAADPVERASVDRDSATWDALAWAEELPLLAAVAADARDPEAPIDTALLEFDATAGDIVTLLDDEDVEEGWTLPLDNDLRFSRDGERLFFGLRERERAEESEPAAEDAEFDILDVDALREEASVDVWHYRDPRIKTHERESLEERSKHLYLAVRDREAGTTLRLAGPELREVMIPDRGDIALAYDREPWLREMTWDGFYRDVWVVDLRDGRRELVARRIQDTVSRSPEGRYVLWFADGVFHLYDTATGESRDVSSGLGVPFADEDHDYPRDPPDYGIGGWSSDDSSVLLYDKYDVWIVPTAGSEARNLTEGRGRAERRIYRVYDPGHGPEGLDPSEPVLLTGFDELAKNSSIWTVDLSARELERRREDERYYRILARARDAERYLYTEERYDLFGDLWVAREGFRKAARVTDLNPRLRDYDLGEAELVEWASDDGIPLQGVLIKPANYDPDRRYPVLLYYYRFMSDRLHRFNEPVINHRPSFYMYAADGYAIFLPDIRFEIGRPGASAAKCLLPGVQRIVDLGIADPEAIALHGHSWSGYQTAQVVTLTDRFACAVAGAPVSNMTSAYGGIRYGTGLSRQFQYEMTQSRIGASLFERRDLYIENSPVFFADRINTPLLIQFGDEDEAVPWTQGVELYMAMRRLDKPCVFLQYHGEPHHLKKYPNKLDYTLRMKSFIDHFCKGAPAPDWWANGEPIRSDD
jgi:dipeptidyl aminopeptidase/acylaminoacyl peptidase